MSGARFTVVCPAYNRSVQLAATIESVLSQTRGDLELLVGSDGSTDDTDDIVAGFARADRRVKLLSLAHTGDPGLVRGRLCWDISSDYVAYIDHDDRWRDNHLAVLGAALDGGALLAASGAEYQYKDGASAVLRGRSLQWHPELAVVDPYAEPSRVAHRKDVLDSAGGWRRAGRGLEDWDLWWRMSARGIALQPVDAPSAVVAISGSTRRNSLEYKMVAPLAGTGNEAAARAAAGGWAGERLTGALAEDFRHWAGEIDGDPQTVLPLPCQEFKSDAGQPAAADPAGPDAAVSSQPGAALTLAVFPGGRDGWLVGLGAPIVSRGHGRSMEAVITRRFPAALAHLRSALSRRLQDVDK
ncbi:MAG: hypothetical protein JWQ75_798 [Pseudarthrobacter sp.]|nr:hypothetical protein [Pseudarthrobacter sp.]